MLELPLWKKALFSILATGSTGVAPFLLAALIVPIRMDLNVDPGSIGLFVALFFGATAASSLVSGRLADLFGGSTCMKVGAFLSGLALVIQALTRSSLTFGSLFVLAGLGNALSQVGTSTFIAAHGAANRSGLLFGVKQAGVPMAAMVGGATVAALGVSFGWRHTFLLTGLLAMCVGVSIPRNPGERSRRPSINPAQPFNRTLGTLVISATFASTAAIVLASYLVDSLVSQDLTLREAGLLYAVGSGLSLVTRVAAGWWADRQVRGRLVATSLLLLVGALGFLLLGVAPNKLLVRVGVLVAFVGSWGWSGLFQFSIVRAYGQSPGAASGIVQAGLYTGGIAGPILFGAIARHFSYATMWLAASAVAIFASIGLLIGRRDMTKAS